MYLSTMGSFMLDFNQNEQNNGDFSSAEHTLVM